MGLAASQARFLNLTCRLSQVQRQGQAINQERSALASQMNQMMTQNKGSASVNPFFTGGGDSPEYGQSKNGTKKNSSNNQSSYSGFSQSFSSIISSLAGAASSYPGANMSPMQLDSSKLAAIQAQDMQLEMLLRTLDTQEQALKTEIGAVQKVIDKNVEGSFKLMA